MKIFKSKILHQKIKQSHILNYLDQNEINLIKKKHKVSFYFKIRRECKFFLYRLVNFFINTNTLIKPRSLEKVKKKYEKISGTYIESYLDKKRSFYAEIENKKIVRLSGGLENYYSGYLLNIIKETKVKSFLEVGAGEFTLIYDLLKKIKNKKFNIMAALDIAFKRLDKGNKFLKKRKINLDYLVKGDAANLPFADNSFDLIYTSHCLEQVPHLFDEIIKECVRVTKKYVVLIEPSYEFGSDITKDHIYKKGYPKISNKSFKQDNYKIILRKGLPIKSLINGTEIIILKKKEKKKESLSNIYVCPSCKNYLKKDKNKLLCQKERIFYTIKSNIALLEKNDGKLF